MRPASNRWLVPFGGCAGKIVKVDKQPFVWQVNPHYNTIRPQDLPDPKLQERLQVVLLPAETCRTM